MIEQLNLQVRAFLAQAMTAEFWWQVLVILLAIGAATFINRRVQVVLELRSAGTGLRHLAVRSAQRLLFPVSMLMVLVSGSAILERESMPVLLLDLAVPIVVALGVVRLSVYVLRKAFTVNPLLKSSEHALALIVWGLVMLHLLGWLSQILAVLDNIAMQLGETRISVLSVVQLMLIVGVAFTLAIWISEAINRYLRRSVHISPSMQVGVSKFSRFLLITIAFLMALNAVGIDLSSLAIFGGALGVGLGFGLQRIASNFISGFILVLDRSIKPGDVITVGDKFGWVHELKARYVVVRNREGVDTLIPNENLITSEVINWSYMDRNVRLKIPVQISYDDDPEQAMEIMTQCAYASPRVLRDPEPLARLMGFGDSGIDLEVRVWIGDPESGFGNVRSSVNLAIWRAFKEAGITIPFPQRDLNIKHMPAKDSRLDN